MTKPNFQKRRIGKTALEVTTLGLGGASIAGNGGPVSPDQARATVVHAREVGINYFDTAPQYGLGRSEHLMGDVLREDHGGLVISTKVGRLLRTFKGQRRYPHNWAEPPALRPAL